MPRDITYSKLRQVSPGATHLQNTTDIVESTFPVGVKLYSSDISPSGRRGAPVYMNLTAERKGYNLPIHISIGVGTSPSNFRPLAVYRNVDPDNNTLFPIEFNIPLDIEVGTYILWYKVEPVTPDITKSPRLEVLTHSPVSSEVKTLTVSASSANLGLNFNVAPDVLRVYDVNSGALVHIASPAPTSSVISIDVGAGKNIRVEATKSGYYTIYDTFFLSGDLTRTLNFGSAYSIVGIMLNKVGFGNTTISSSQNTLSVPYSLQINYSRSLTASEMESEKTRFINLLSTLAVTFAGSNVNLPTFNTTSIYNSNDDITLTYDTTLNLTRTSPGATNTTVILKLVGNGVNVSSDPFNLIINAANTSEGIPVIVNYNDLNNLTILDTYTSSTVLNVHVMYPVDSSWSLALGNSAITASSGFTAALDTQSGYSPDVAAPVDGSADLPPNEAIIKVRVSRVSDYSEGGFNVSMRFFNSVLNSSHTITFNFTAAKHVNAVTYVSQNVNVAETRKGMFYYYTDTAQGVVELQPMNYISSTNAIGDGFRNNMNNVNMYNRAALGGPFFHTLYFDPINIPKEPISVKLTIPIPSGTYIALSADTYNGLTANKDVYGMKVMIPTQSRQILTFNGNPNILTNALSPRLNGVTNPNGVDYLDLNADIRNNIGGRVTVDLLPSVVNRSALSQGLVITVMYTTTYKLALNSGNTQSGFSNTMGQFRGTSVLPSIPINMPFATSQYGEYKIEVNL